MGRWKEFSLEEFVNGINRIVQADDYDKSAENAAKLFLEVDKFYQDQLTLFSGGKHDARRQCKSPDKGDAQEVQHP